MPTVGLLTNTTYEYLLISTTYDYEPSILPGTLQICTISSAPKYQNIDVTTIRLSMNTQDRWGKEPKVL